MNSPWPRRILFGLLIFVLLALQSANTLAIGGVDPDFMLILVLLYAISYGDFKGEVFGFVVGILQDSMSGGIFGVSAFIYTFLGWFTNFYKKYILVSDLVAFMIYVIIATFLKYLFYSLFYLIFKGAGFFSGMFFLKMGGEVAYNAFMGVLFFLVSPFLFVKQSDSF